MTSAEKLWIFLLRSSEYLPRCPELVTNMFQDICFRTSVSGHEQNLGVDWEPTVSRLGPTSNSYAGIHILLMGPELIGFNRKSRSLHPVSLVPLSGCTCGDLLGLAEGLQIAGKGHKQWSGLQLCSLCPWTPSRLDKQPGPNPALRRRLDLRPLPAQILLQFGKTTPPCC